MGDDRQLTREDFFSTERLEEVEVEYGALEGAVYAQPVPFALGKKIIRASEDEEGDVQDLADEIILYGIVDADGHRIFREEDRERIDNLPNPVGMTLANAVLDVSELGAVEEADGDEADSGN